MNSPGASSASTNLPVIPPGRNSPQQSQKVACDRRLSPQGQGCPCPRAGFGGLPWPVPPVFRGTPPSSPGCSKPPRAWPWLFHVQHYVLPQKGFFWGIRSRGRRLRPVQVTAFPQPRLLRAHPTLSHTKCRFIAKLQLSHFTLGSELWSLHTDRSHLCHLPGGQQSKNISFRTGSDIQKTRIRCPLSLCLGRGFCLSTTTQPLCETKWN